MHSLQSLSSLLYSRGQTGTKYYRVFFWISWIIGSHFSFVKVVVEVCILYMRRGKANSQISDGKSICLQCGRPGFNPWLRKIPWRRKWQPTPVFLPGKFHGQRSLVGYSPGGHRVGHDWVTSLSLSLSCIGEGNGNPLQCSCLENPGTGEPGGLLSMGSHRVGHDWSDLTAAAWSFYF